MTMRAHYVPEDLRSTIINCFRIPLNLFVCVILYNVSRLGGCNSGFWSGRTPRSVVWGTSQQFNLLEIQIFSRLHIYNIYIFYDFGAYSRQNASIRQLL